MINTDINKILISEYEDATVRCATFITYNIDMKRWEIYSHSNLVICFTDLDAFTEQLRATAIYKIEPQKEKLEKALEAWKKVMESD